MKTKWILIALFAAACVLNTSDRVYAQGEAADIAADAAVDPTDDDEDAVAAEPINLKFSTRRATVSGKSLINIVMDASGSMGEMMSDPATGDEHKRGDYVRAAVQDFVAELKPDTTSAGLVLFGHRTYWKKDWEKKSNTKKATTDDDDASGDDDNAGDEEIDDENITSVVFQSPMYDSGPPENGVFSGPSFGFDSGMNNGIIDGAIIQGGSVTAAPRSDYKIGRSEIGKEQFPNDTEPVNPSFDVKQELEVLAVDDAQKADFIKLTQQVTFESGAPTPLHQAVLEGVKQLKAVESDAENRDVIIVTDEFNRLADFESRMKDVQLSQIRQELTGGAVRIHWVLFGPEFQPDPGFTQLDPYKQQELAKMKSLAEDFGGSLRLAPTPKLLALSMVPLVNPATKARLGVVKGLILKSGKPVGARSDFTVELKGGDGEPVPAADGKFSFDKVEIGKEYSLIIKGRVRNSVYEKTIEKVAAAPAAKAKDVKVELE